MSSSASLPSPDDDYAAPLDARLNKAFWDAALKSVGARIRALEAVKADWQELISQGTGQALAVIQANVEPQLVALTAIIDQLKADVAAAEDAIATIVAGGVTMANVTGLSAALALKANITYVDAAVAALKGDAPAAYDTLVEIATKLSEDDSAIAGLLTTIATKASKTTRLKVGGGLSLNGVPGSDVAPVEGDLSADRLVKLVFATPVEAAAGVITGIPVDPAGMAQAISALARGVVYNGATLITASGNYTPTAGTQYIRAVIIGGGGGGARSSGSGYGGGGGAAAIGEVWAKVDDTHTYPVTIGAGGARSTGTGTAGTGGTTSIEIDGTTYSATGGAGGAYAGNGGAPATTAPNCQQVRRSVATAPPAGGQPGIGLLGTYYGVGGQGGIGDMSGSNNNTIGIGGAIFIEEFGGMTNVAHLVDNGIVTNSIILSDDADPASFGAITGPAGAGIGWTYDGTNWAAPVEQGPVLEDLRAAAMADVDIRAEAYRLTFITAGSGQAMAYTQKLDEARAYLASPSLTAAECPHIFAEVGITGETPEAVAQVVVGMHAAWQVTSAEIERKRLAAKAAIDAAETVDAINAAAEVNWSA